MLTLRLPRRRRVRAVPTVRIRGLDGSHTGIAMNLWQAALDNDTDLVEAIVESVPADEAFASCVDLLLALAYMLSEMEQTCPMEPCDGGHRFLIRLGHTEGLEEFSLLCHQLAAGLARNPNTSKARVTSLPVLAFARLFVVLGEHLEDNFGIEPGEVMEQLRDYVLDRRADEAGVL